MKVYSSIFNFKGKDGSSLRYNKKSVCIAVIKFIVFLLIFLILFHDATDLFRTKSAFYMINPIYGLPKNSVDVLLFGTSHMVGTISPMDLWSEYGITSFNAGLNEQTIPSTYFEMREILKVQRPKIIVLEIYYIIQKEMITSAGKERFHWFVDNVPFSSGVSEAIQTVMEEEDKTEYYLNFYSFHNRWKSLAQNDFQPWLSNTRWNRGGDVAFYMKHSVQNEPSIVSQYETKTPPEIPLEYIYKIISLCRENGIQLIFVTQPFSASDNNQKMFNYIGAVAEEENIPYINFFYFFNEIGFDFAEDMADGEHVNYFGNQKLTSYLGEYLQTTYHLEDHRNDPKIADLWNKDYQTFSRELNNTMMKTAKNLDEYFTYLQNQDYIIAWNAYSKTALSETSLPHYLKTMDLDPSEIKEENWYCAVTRGGQPLYQKSFSKKPNDTYMVEDALFSFGSGITGSRNAIGVHVGRKEYSVGKTGVNLVVYDPISRKVVDSVNIDLNTGTIKRK